MMLTLRVGDTRRRLLIVIITTAAVFTAILGRVVYLQTVGSDDLLAAGRAQRVQESAITAQRGTIFARDGGELALSVPSQTVYADPRQIEDPIGAATALATVLGLSDQKFADLVDEFTRKEKSFVYVARQVDDDVASMVASLQLPGVDFLTEARRIMPSGAVGRSILGRTDIDGSGIAGLERQFDDLLRGLDGERVRERDRQGRSIPGSGATTVEPVPGTDLVLTIDRSLQYQVEQALIRRVSELKGKGGVVVVMDTVTGDIYAMANVVQRDDGVVEVASANLAVVEMFEPGSVAKVFSLSAVVDAGLASPETEIDVPGVMVFNKGTEWEQPIRDAVPHDLESMTLRRIMSQSSNIGTLMLAEQLGNRRLADYLVNFGIGRSTGLGFPDESSGLIKPSSEWQGAEPATISFGYGYTTTSLQLAAAVNAVANGGTYVAPRLLAATIDPRGSITEAPASATRRVMSPNTASIMADLMRDVVCEGTGRDARIDGISVAGKTGTAYKVQDGSYGADGSRQYRASFVGFFPAAAPRVTVLVTIDEPDPTSGDRFGGKAAAPLFAELAVAAIHELAVTPSPGDTGCSTR